MIFYENKAIVIKFLQNYLRRNLSIFRFTIFQGYKESKVFISYLV